MIQHRFRQRFNPFNIEPGKINESEADLRSWQALATKKLSPRKPEADMRRLYRRNLDASMVAALVLTLSFLFWLRHIDLSSEQITVPTFEFIVEQIPPTEQIKRPPRPERPSVALPSDDEDIPADETIAITDFDFAEIPPPPEPPQLTDESADVFVEYDTPPEPIGGYAALYQYLQYPPLARRAGLEARVLVQVVISATGELEEVKILKDSGTKVGFEDAAIEAVKKLRWRPALQRDKPVRVMVTIPIRFALADDVSL